MRNLDLKELWEEIEDFRLNQISNKKSDREKDLDLLEKNLGCSLYEAWKQNVNLISEADFKDFAMEEAKCLSEVNFNDWPYNRIDWDQAAEDLKSDFTCIEFDGATYYTRDV